VEDVPRETPPELSARLGSLEDRVAVGFESIEAAIEQLAAQLPHRDAR